MALQVVVVSACTHFSKATGMPQNHSSLTETVLEVTGIHRWPGDIRAVLSTFGLDPDLCLYACCPRCFAIYPLQPSNNSYPKLCTFRETPSSRPCNTMLVKHGAAGKPPELIRTFGYQSMRAWIGRLLSRPDIEKAIAQMTAPHPRSFISRLAKLWSSGPVKDIWDAEVFRTFKGPNGKHWLDAPPGEARLVFGLFVDWFNPYGNRTAGKSASVGGIYMVCMNLPVGLRYRVENVYLVGIIPGPKEPSLHQMNHLLRPLVDDLLVFWYTGVYFTRTADYAFGRLVRAVIIPLICDLPAMRKTAGFAHFSSTEGGCSYCWLSKDELDNFDITSFKRRTWKEHLVYAFEWLRAPSESARNKLFEQHRTRWSELLRLPYWDPIRFSVVDSMHNLFLNDLSHHCRQVWGMNAEKSKTSSVSLHTPEQQAEELKKGVDAIRKLSKTGLEKLRRGYVVAIAQANNIQPSGSNQSKKATKKMYSDGIIQFVSLSFPAFM